jgi:hypothetical protein
MIFGVIYQKVVKRPSGAGKSIEKHPMNEDLNRGAMLLRRVKPNNYLPGTGTRLKTHS